MFNHLRKKHFNEQNIFYSIWFPGIDDSIIFIYVSGVIIMKNKYFDLRVRRYHPERPKIENLSPDAQFFSSKRLLEGGKEYLSYAHWKKGLDRNNKVLDTPDYWKELDHFYIYEQN